MDTLADGVSEIGSIARICVQALQSPDRENGHRYVDDVVIALQTIEDKASDVRNSINHTAEDVGCNDVEDITCPPPPSSTMALKQRPRSD